MNPLVIQPSVRKLWVCAFVCLAAAVGGVLMIADPESGGMDKYVGVLVLLIGLSGAAGLMYRAMNVRPLLTLTHGGIENGWGGLIPWSDITHVGVGKLKSGPRFAGIIMRDYTHYLQSLPEGYDSRARKYAWAGAGLAAATVPMNFNWQGAAQAALTLDPGGLVNWEFLSAPKRDVAKQLLWGRGQQDGYDLVWVQAALPQSAEATVKIVLDYWAAAATWGHQS